MIRPRDSRSAALYVLLQGHAREAFAQELLDGALREAKLSSADRRLATQLTYGTLRRRGTLDALIGHLVTRPRDQVEQALWEVLRLGAYQIVFLDHVPNHAAVHETVNLANALDRAKAKGFLNGVLRSLTRLLTDDVVERPGRNTIAIRPGEHRRLTKAVFADPEKHPDRHLSQSLSVPLWLVRRWLERYDFAECARLGFWFQEPASVWLRVNPLKTDRETLLQKLTEAEVKAEVGSHPQSIHLTSSCSIPDLPGFSEGHFTVQDESAMGVATGLNPTPGMRVLDLCAAPGGKSTHLAELMNNEGEIVACDVDEKRLKLVSNSAERLGMSSIQTRLLNPDQSDDFPTGLFDAILVDVPCSNTGVLGRRPEARWRLKEEELSHLARLQLQLMHRACDRVKPGGVVLYSTCSIEPEENQELIRTVLKEKGGFVLETESQQVPGLPADGGYWARLIRQGNDAFHSGEEK